MLQVVAAAEKLKPKRESAQKRSHTRRNHNASGGCPNKIQTQTRNANPPEDGRIRAAFTMQAVAAPTKMKPKRESARRCSHTRRTHNASGGGPSKIETQNKNQREDGHTRAAVRIEVMAAPRKLKPERESARRCSNTPRIYNASGRGPNKI